VTGKLLKAYDIRAKTISYHDHNAAHILPEILNRLAAGEIVALVSDAGTPLISDPGYRLVHEARAAGHDVCSLPGASAMLCALTSSGLPTDKFMFVGFLESKMMARQKELSKYKKLGASLIFYESAKRLAASLKDMLEVLGNRNAAVCRELTKLYEEIRSDNLENLVHFYEENGAPKGEIVIIVSPPLAQSSDDFDLDDALTEAFKKLSLKEAVAAVTYMSGLKRKAVYSRALELAGKK
jgi:16S rRNA (cytidine1402-2'-O)-methyltransferase